MIKRIIAMLISVLLGLFSACSKNDVYINGSVEQTIEAGSLFEDAGVTYPKDYTLITYGGVDTKILERQKITYLVYSEDGSLVKEMHRFVNVVDTTAPSFTLSNQTEYYAGITYTAKDFLSEYSDNYDNELLIGFSNEKYTFNEPGTHSVKFNIFDSSNNSATIEQTIYVKLDMVKLLEHVYKNTPYVISTSTTGMGSTHTHVKIDSKKSLGYFSTGSIHYLERITTTLGSYASIQVSANYGHFSNASVSFHVSNQGNDYSVLFATTDATNTNVSVIAYEHNINDLNLDISKMQQELQNNLPSILLNFTNYMNNTLHLKLQ